MSDINNREDRERKPKEYYQINLDMGRIFWIVFLLGVVVIGIFVLGFFVGGGKDKGGVLSIGNKTKNEAGEVIVKKLFGEEEGEKENKVDIQEIFNQHPEGETQVVNKKSLQDALENVNKEKVKQPKSYIKKEFLENTNVSSTKAHVYKPVGDYYIQVASFEKKENALKLKQKLEKNLYKVKIEKAVINGKSYYRVRVGPFISSSVARNTMIAMKRRFNLTSPFIVKKNS